MGFPPQSHDRVESRQDAPMQTYGPTATSLLGVRNPMVSPWVESQLHQQESMHMMDLAARGRGSAAAGLQLHPPPENGQQRGVLCPPSLEPGGLSPGGRLRTLGSGPCPTPRRHHRHRHDDVQRVRPAAPVLHQQSRHEQPCMWPAQILYCHGIRLSLWTRGSSGRSSVALQDGVAPSANPVLCPALVRRR